jgi:hypothetical protein
LAFDATALPARREACIAQGRRQDRTINAELDTRVAAHPDSPGAHRAAGEGRNGLALHLPRAVD